MSALQHTPGPWFHDTRGYPHPDVKAADGRNIACTWGVNCQPKTKQAAQTQKQIARANARLIAQSPAMFDFIKLVAGYTGEGPSTTPWQEIVKDLSDEARALVAKVSEAQS